MKPARRLCAVAALWFTFLAAVRADQGGATMIPTIAEAARLIAKKELSPVELTRAALARIAQAEPQLNAFITVTEDAALADAKRAEAEIAARGPRGPLHGIPYGLK